MVDLSGCIQVVQRLEDGSIRFETTPEQEAIPIRETVILHTIEADDVAQALLDIREVYSGDRWCKLEDYQITAIKNIACYKHGGFRGYHHV